MTGSSLKTSLHVLAKLHKKRFNSTATVVSEFKSVVTSSGPSQQQ